MKKTAIFLSVSLLAVQASAQEYYHDGVEVCSNGITYDVKLNFLALILTNKANSLIYGTWTYPDGSIIKSDHDENLLNTELEFEENSFKEALKKTFTKAEFDKLHAVNGIKFNIYCVIDNDLIIRELDFYMSIYEDPIFLQIPPAKYALLEKNIKKYVKIEANEYAEKFKYMHATKFVDFSKIQIDYDSETPGPYTKPASQKGP
ncbi:hypothetical protein [uncultured Alistipes sp.]|uniref:hypothetical protein n=1 Tax=uncultured Alistipes sp. TaxID=538949 RepID=UPI00262FDBBE|nr:hypothetical protein [uncultured Alistipes sp.]